jgi:cation-transporting P-type ATPase E
VLQIRAGDQVVVDGRVIGGPRTGGRIEVDESLLTGESDRVPKRPGDPVYSGSFCVAGSARYVATGVGVQSFANRLTQSAQALRQVKTPLQKDIDFIVRMLVLMVAQLGVLISLQDLRGGPQFGRAGAQRNGRVLSVAQHGQLPAFLHCRQGLAGSLA